MRDTVVLIPQQVCPDAEVVAVCLQLAQMLGQTLRLSNSCLSELATRNPRKNFAHCILYIVELGYRP